MLVIDAYGVDHIWYSAWAQGEHERIDTFEHVQRGSSIKDFNMYSGGVWIAECISRERICWSALCP